MRLSFEVPAMPVFVKTTSATGKKVRKKDSHGIDIADARIFPKERPRVGIAKGTGRRVVYSSDNMVKFEAWIRRHFFKAYPGSGGIYYKGEPWPVHSELLGCKVFGEKVSCQKFKQGKDFLDCQVCDSRRKNLKLYLEVHLRDDRHMDLDNFMKIALDSLNKVCFYDDGQFIDKRVILVPYAPEEKLVVLIEDRDVTWNGLGMLGGYTLKKIPIQQAEKYVKDYIMENKDIFDRRNPMESPHDKLLEYLMRCDGRKYIQKIEQFLKEL